MLIGGLAVIVHGVSRATRDVGATLLAANAGWKTYSSDLRHGIVPRIPMHSNLPPTQVLLLRHQPSVSTSTSR